MPRQSGYLGVALVVLTACASHAPIKALPPEFLEEVNAAAFAETIAEHCSSLAFDRQLEDRVLIGFAFELQTRGYTAQDLNDADLDEDAALREVLAYVDQRGIVFAQEGTWCRAGQAEIAEKSRIGQYLVRL